ncbi:MAG: hypothetical protein C0483_08380 [Pirellula sp.]|nr:hypothetical protein [Pirellula sp.]
MEATLANYWHIDDTLARYDAPSLKALIDLNRPFAGLQQPAVAGGTIDATTQILGVGLNEPEPWQPSLAESYARGRDLVATYPQTDARPYRLQAYWHVVDVGHGALADVAACVELQVSINTSLLDTAPVVVVGNLLPADDAVDLPAYHGCATLVRPRGADWSYVQIVHPVDHAHPCGTTQTPAGLQLRTRLFGRYLEKGVIMRARVRGAMVARARDEAAATALYNDFLHAPLPLTT